MGLTILPKKYVDQPRPDTCLYASGHFGERMGNSFRDQLFEDLWIADISEKKRWRRAIRKYCTENKGVSLCEIVGNNNPTDWPMMLVFTLD